MKAIEIQKLIKIIRTKPYKRPARLRGGQFLIRR